MWLWLTNKFVHNAWSHSNICVSKNAVFQRFATIRDKMAKLYIIAMRYLRQDTLSLALWFAHFWVEKNSAKNLVCAEINLQSLEDAKIHFGKIHFGLCIT